MLVSNLFKLHKQYFTYSYTINDRIIKEVANGNRQYNKDKKILVVGLRKVVTF